MRGKTSLVAPEEAQIFSEGWTEHKFLARGQVRALGGTRGRSGGEAASEPPQSRMQASFEFGFVLSVILAQRI